MCAVPKKYGTDIFMMKLWRCLASDFTSAVPALSMAPLREFRSAFETADFSRMRHMEWPGVFQTDPAFFKRQIQLESLFKRYRFTNDAYSTPQLEQMTNDKFVATQERLGKHDYTLTMASRQVIQRARGIVRLILGEYDLEEHMSHCRFGRRATVGNPLSRSYLDQKLSGPLSCSPKHMRWFENSYLPTDDLLSEVIGQRSKEPTYTMCDALSLVNVPKTWKSLRSIMPNTTIGSFITSGLGTLFVKRLKDYGLDIRKLQSVHRQLARHASLYPEKLVTADLSAASDSITWQILCMLLPRKWLHAVNDGRIRYCHLGDSKTPIQMISVMGMGIGFTFPLQTLVFYSLIKAIAELTDSHGIVSVYGDDLIYPTRIHKYVEKTFGEIGFIMNKDKTFVYHAFRESCGGDYYRGVDVRPFNPEGQGCELSRIRYLALIYKTINGLLERWDMTEISGTYHWLCLEILRLTDRIYQVPPDFPSYSGIKVTNPLPDWYMQYSAVSYCMKTYNWSFRALKEVPGDRIVPQQISYLWDSLRAGTQPDEEDDSWVKNSDSRFTRPSLKWIRTEPPRFVRSKLTGRRLQRKIAVVPLRGAVRLVNNIGHTSVWTVGCK